MKLTTKEKQILIHRYNSGESISSICKETGVARSTLYAWIQNEKSVQLEIESITPHQYALFKQHQQKLEAMVAILQSVHCCVFSPLSEKFEAIESLQDQYSIHALCEALKVPRGTYYNHIFRNKRENSSYIQNRQRLMAAIRKIFDENHQVFGSGKITAILRQQGYTVSPKMVSELMREMNLTSVSTNSKKEYLRWKKGENRNVLQQQFHADEPNKIWVSDFTVFSFHEKSFYICIILDLFSRKIVAYRISNKCSTQLVTKAFKKAYAERQPERGLIFHSDRGGAYVSYAFQKLLNKYGVTQSLSRSGKPHDNAVSESFFSYLKKEELYRRKYKSEAELRKGIEKYMVFYNSVRPHSSLQYKTPDKKEELFIGQNDTI